MKGAGAIYKVVFHLLHVLHGSVIQQEKILVNLGFSGGWVGIAREARSLHRMRIPLKVETCGIISEMQAAELE
jgi:hypothetical protein